MGYFQERLEYVDNKSMFRILRSLEVRQMQLTEFNSTKESCNIFSRYFQERIEKLLNSLHCHTAVDHSVEETPRFSYSLEVFEPTNTAEIASILANTDKRCSLDPLPTKQLLCVTNASYVLQMKVAIKNRQGTALVLVDFSAAFDTINHKKIIQRLRLRYGIVDKALGWSAESDPASSNS